MLKPLQTVQEGSVVLNDASVFAQDICIAIAKFNENDFEAAGLNPRAPHEYSTREAAVGKLATISEFALPYSIALTDIKHNITPAGFAILMDKNATKLHRISRKLGFLDRSKERRINGWLNLEQVNIAGYSGVETCTRIVETLAVAASRLGLTALDTVLTSEKEGKNPDLIVIEHTAELAAIGFKEVGVESFEDQGNVYEGVLWRKEL